MRRGLAHLRALLWSACLTPSPEANAGRACSSLGACQPCDRRGACRGRLLVDGGVRPRLPEVAPAQTWASAPAAVSLRASRSSVDEWWNDELEPADRRGARRDRAARSARRPSTGERGGRGSHRARGTARHLRRLSPRSLLARRPRSRQARGVLARKSSLARTRRQA